MRLFAAIELGDAITSAARTLMTELQHRAGGARGAKLTWVDPERMHLTVRFIGEVDDEHATRIQAALAEPVPLPPFDMGCRGLHVFPSARRPRVIVCEVAQGRDDARRLEEIVSDRLEQVGVPREARAYTPHVTLARVRDAGHLRVERLFDGVEAADLGRVRVDAITLFQSRVSPNGPTYTALARSPLAA